MKMIENEAVLMCAQPKVSETHSVDGQNNFHIIHAIWIFQHQFHPPLIVIASLSAYTRPVTMVNVEQQSELKKSVQNKVAFFIFFLSSFCPQLTQHEFQIFRKLSFYLKFVNPRVFS